MADNIIIDDMNTFMNDPIIIINRFKLFAQNNITIIEDNNKNRLQSTI